MPRNACGAPPRRPTRCLPQARGAPSTWARAHAPARRRTASHRQRAPHRRGRGGGVAPGCRPTSVDSYGPGHLDRGLGAGQSATERVGILWRSGSIVERVKPDSTRKWRNWQTRKPQELVGAIPWGFESPLPHHSTRPSTFPRESSALSEARRAESKGSPVASHVSDSNPTTRKFVGPAGRWHRRLSELGVCPPVRRRLVRCRADA